MELNRPPGFSTPAICPPHDPTLESALQDALEASPRCSTHGHQVCRDFYERWEAEVGQLDLTWGGSVQLSTAVAPTRDGATVDLMVLKPRLAPGPLPVIYYIHGGGMIMGNASWNLETLVPMVADGSTALVSVEYRLAPEHPDPVPVEDCYAGFAWVAENAIDLGIDPARLIIAGVSAGGGLAAGVALMARDRHFPRISTQILICPMLDDRFETPSSCMLDGRGSWDRNDNLYGWTALLGDRRGGPEVTSYCAPAREEDLFGLPNTYIDVGSAEGFRDEVLTYAGRLSQAGVLVDLHMWGGGFHAFDLDVPDAAISRDAIAAREAFLRRALDAPRTLGASS